MRACSGTWIAHGSGTADRDVVDARDRVVVPPPPEAAAYNSARMVTKKRRPATTTASRTRASGPCATSRTCGLSSAGAIGTSTKR